MARYFSVLQLTTTVRVNAVIWISSLTNLAERQSTEQVLAFLEPFLSAISVPFFRHEPKSALELSQFLQQIERQTASGLRPIIHFDTHGGKKDGLYIADSKQFVPWRDLAAMLRPINIASGNNLCVVSAACFSLHTIRNVRLAAATPFFALIAPERTVTFGFIESHMFDFYEKLLTSGDITSAFEDHLAPLLNFYLAERLLLTAITKYLRDGFVGKGGRNRWRQIFKDSIGAGLLADTPQNRKLIRSQTRAGIKPTQGLIDNHAAQFLVGKQVKLDIAELVSLARQALIRQNVGDRRRARGLRKIRRTRYARRRFLNAR
jgi:hypothetical protein